MRFFISIFGVILIVVSLLLAYQRRNDFPQYIAFLSNRDGNSEVFIMNDDGSHVRQLTHTNSFENREGHCWFSWSASELDIYAVYGNGYKPSDFACYHGYGTLSRFNLKDGSSQPIKVDEAYLRAPKSSTGLSYLSTKRIPTQQFPDYVEVYQTNRHTNQHEFLFSVEESWAMSETIQWSTDENWVVFAVVEHSPTGVNFELHRFNMKNKEIQVLKNALYIHSRCNLFSLSPDSQWLYFGHPSEDGGPCGNLYRTKLANEYFGADIELVTTEPVYLEYDANELIWSPSGKYLASWNIRQEIIVIKVETGETKVLTDSVSSTYYGLRSISWSLDDQWLAITKCKSLETNCHLYKIKQDGTEIEQLTFGEHEDIDPQYAPVGELDWWGELPFGIGVFLLMVGVVRKLGVR